MRVRVCVCVCARARARLCVFVKESNSWKCKTNKSTLHKDLCSFMILFPTVLLKIKLFQTNVVHKFKIHILGKIFFFPEKRADYKTM